jgi:type IV secretory pathway VirD2 relaxase
MPVLVKALGYHSHKGGKAAKGLSKLKAHLKYLEFGKAHPNQPQGFTSDRDEISRADFMAEVLKQPERGVMAHKLVFSLSQNERDQLGIDMCQLVRSVMHDWSSRLGRPLTWIGFEHQDKGHPHVHVVVAGYAGEKQVGVFERDLVSLRKSAEREKDRQVELERWAPSRGEQHTLDRELDCMTRELGPILSRTQERQRDRARDDDWDRGR